MNTEKLTAFMQALAYQDQENDTDLSSEVIFAIQNTRTYFDEEAPTEKKLTKYLSDQLQQLELIEEAANEAHIEVIEEVLQHLPALVVQTMFSK